MHISRVQIQQKIPIIALMVYSFLLIVWSLVAINNGRSMDSWQVQVAGGQLVWVTLYLAATFAYFRTMYLFSTAYVTVLMLFHTGLFWQYAFGAVSIAQWDGEFGKWIYLAEWYLSMALGAYGCGFAAYCLSCRQIPIPGRDKTTQLTAFNLRKLRLIGTGLLIASTVLIILAVMQLGNILRLTRFKLFYEGDTRFIGVFSMIFPAAVMILFITAATLRQRMQAYVFTTFAFLLLLLSGSRSTALYPALTGLIIWAKLGRRIPLVLLLAGITFVLLAIPVVGYIRDNSYEKLSTEIIAKSAERADIGSAVSELGGTVGVLAHTLRIIPDEEPYRYGYSYLNYLKQMIPNVSGEVNSEYSRQALKQDIDSRGADALFELSPSDWASYHIIPEMFVMGAGTGFSAIGEAYFNFGIPGVIVTFALFGLLIARLDTTLLPHNYRTLLFASLFFGLFLPTVRNEFAVFIRPAEYTAIVVLIWLMLLRFLPKSGNKKRSPLPQQPVKAISTK
jgi:oligosaccharide repeat unit polymerase